MVRSVDMVSLFDDMLFHSFYEDQAIHCAMYCVNEFPSIIIEQRVRWQWAFIANIYVN